MELDIILSSIIVGALAGFVSGKIMRGKGFGLITNMVVGLIGSVLGGFLFSLLGIYSFGWIGAIVVSVVGAIVFLWILSLFSDKS